MGSCDVCGLEGNNHALQMRTLSLVIRASTHEAAYKIAEHRTSTPIKQMKWIADSYTPARGDDIPEGTLLWWRNTGEGVEILEIL